MENTTTEAPPTVTEKLARAPGEAGTAIAGGTETVLRDGAKIIVHAGEVIVEATKVVIRDIADAGERLGHDAHQAVSPTPEPAKIATIPTGVTAPVA
jgi:hypothetical protein